MRFLLSLILILTTWCSLNATGSAIVNNFSTTDQPSDYQLDSRSTLSTSTYNIGIQQDNSQPTTNKSIKSDSRTLLDTATVRKVEAMLDGYTENIAMLPAKAKCEEVDFLIGSFTEPELQRLTAIHLYTHYFQSKIMGDEAVAIYLTDKWFSTGKVSFSNDMDLINAKIYADFNRQSQIGCQAPELFDDTFSDRPAILYFYDTDCPRCLVESVLIGEILSIKEYPVDLIAFYTGDNQEEWNKYITKHLGYQLDTVNVKHIWDPDMVTDFQHKYGILSTPGLFLIDSDRTILGRKLDGFALKQLLSQMFDTNPSSYGDSDSYEFFSSIMAGAPVREEIVAVADRIYQESGKSLRARSAYKQTMGDYLYYIGIQQSEDYKLATGDIIDRYILGQPIWDTQTDTLQIIDYADFLKGMLSKAPYGSRLPKVKLDYTVTDRHKTKIRHGRLDRAARNAIVIFHTEGCQRCEAETKAAIQLMQTKVGRKMKVIDVNIDFLFSSHSPDAQILLDELDLSVLPFIVHTDCRGRITNKYISLVDHVSSVSTPLVD